MIRPPPRNTRSQSSLKLSPPLAERPHPTLVDLDLPRRRRLRDGSSSRGSDVSDKSTYTRAAPNSTRLRARETRGRKPIRIDSTRSSTYETTGVTSGYPSDNDYRSSRSESFTPPPPIDTPPPLPPPVTPSRTSRDRHNLIDMIDRIANDRHSQPPVISPVSTQPVSQPFPLQLERSNSAEGSASTSVSDPESAARRYTAQEKGKGRALPPSPIAVDDEEVCEDESFKIVGIKRKRTESDVVVVHDVRDLGEDEHRSLGSFSELYERKSSRGIG